MNRTDAFVAFYPRRDHDIARDTVRMSRTLRLLGGDRAGEFRLLNDTAELRRQNTILIRPGLFTRRSTPQ